MNLADILGPGQIVPKLSAADRWEVIDRLIDVLIAAQKLRPEDRETARKAVKDRETSKSTGIGYGIALPHASVGCVTEITGAFARLNPPIDFQALDNQPVKLCLLLLTPQGQFEKYLHTLSGIARFLSDRQHCQQLESSNTAEEILAVFRPAS